MAGHQIESGLEGGREPEHPLKLLRIAYGHLMRAMLNLDKLTAADL